MSQVNKWFNPPIRIASTEKEFKRRLRFPKVKRYCTLKSGKKIEIKLVETTVKGLRGKTFYKEI